MRHDGAFYFDYVSSFLLYPLLLLKQSKHFKLLVSRGAKGSEVIDAPQPAQDQSPWKRGFSAAGADGSESKPSSICGPSATSASKGKSGTSSAVGISGALAGALPPFDFIKQARQVSPVSLRGIKGSSVIAPPQLLHFQFP